MSRRITNLRFTWIQHPRLGKVRIAKARIDGDSYDFTDHGVTARDFQTHARAAFRRALRRKDAGLA
jgi:hypothetical protein